MRLIPLMTFVLVLLLLAMLPALMQFARMTGVSAPASVAVVAGLLAIVVLRPES